MTYFKIDGTDFSKYVNELSVSKEVNYSAQTNAAGDTVVDYINAKRKITVGIIPLDADAAKRVLSAIDSFGMYISFLNPITNTIEENIPCIVPDVEVDYYTIQVGNTRVNAFTVDFIEL
jgi:hypothetical protein